jgi:hypothetical protein
MAEPGREIFSRTFHVGSAGRKAPCNVALFYDALTIIYEALLLPV